MRFFKIIFQDSESKLVETQLYEQAQAEIDMGHKVKGLWIKSLAQTQGNEQKAEYLYIENRVEELKAGISLKNKESIKKTTWTIATLPIIVVATPFVIIFSICKRILTSKWFWGSLVVGYLSLMALIMLSSEIGTDNDVQDEHTQDQVVTINKIDGSLETENQRSSLILETQDYVIKVTGCDTYVVSCDDAVYEIYGKNTGATLRLVGSTHHTTCVDGVSPCRFLGYSFEINDGYDYWVEHDKVIVTNPQGKIIVNQAGNINWQ